MKETVTSMAVALAGVCVIIAAIFFLGFAVGRKTMPTPVVNTDTVIVVDTNWHHLQDSIINYYELRENALQGQISAFKPLSTKVDTIYVPTPESVSQALISQDTMDILTKYFSVLDYTWEQQDSNLNVVLHTIVTQNEPIKYDLSYSITRPSSYITNTVDNTTTFSRYVQVGVALPSNILVPYDGDFNRWRTIHTDLQLITKKGYLGVEYYPALNIMSVKFGITLLKF